MENANVSLPKQQALVSVPKNLEEQKKEIESSKIQIEEQEKMKKSAEWFRELSVGSILYAIIYAVCVYRNTGGITFPFCVGVTLYFFYYYAKKFCGTVRKCDRFLMIAVVILGVIICTTDSGVLIYFNKIAILLLVCIYLLELFYNVNGWSFAAFTEAGFYVVFGGIGQMVMPYVDGKAFWKLRKHRKEKVLVDEIRKQKIIAILVGLVISIPMLFVIILLLASADIYFRELFINLFDVIFSWEMPELFNRNMFEFLGTILMMFLFSYGIITYITQKKRIEEAVAEKSEQWNSYIAITFSSIMGIVYVLFAGIQILGLFMGALVLPEGYTYASYARQGFFQLAFVCFFNICLVIICVTCFKENKILKGIMTVISVCTYVMLVSSAYRMLLYVSVYQLTFLRVFVLWTIVLMAIVMAGIMISIFEKTFPLFRYLLVSVTVLYIGFATAHPDYWIAKYNIAQAKEGKEIDEYYLLCNLSLDASIPVLEYYDDHFVEEKMSLESRRLYDYCRQIKQETSGMNWRTFNFSKSIASYKNQEYIMAETDQTKIMSE